MRFFFFFFSFSFFVWLLPVAVDGASFRVTDSYWCGTYQYSCGKGCYASAARTCTKYDCPAGSSGTFYTPRVYNCYSCPSGRYAPAANHVNFCYQCPGGTYVKIFSVLLYQSVMA
jgi:hypothetical protein